MASPSSQPLTCVQLSFTEDMFGLRLRGSSFTTTDLQTKLQLSGSDGSESRDFARSSPNAPDEAEIPDWKIGVRLIADRRLTDDHRRNREREGDAACR